MRCTFSVRVLTGRYAKPWQRRKNRGLSVRVISILIFDFFYWRVNIKSDV